MDVYRSAKLLIDKYGKTAPIVAAQRADELLAAGDMDGKIVWLAISRAIEEMQRGRRDGETVN